VSQFKQRKTDNGWLDYSIRSYSVNKATDIIMQDMPLLTTAGRPIAGSWDGKKTVRLDEVLKNLIGYYPVTRQMIGDCVSFGYAKALMISIAVDILMRGENEEWRHEVATEWIYGAARKFAGGGRLGNDDGLVGSWAAKSILDNGVLFRTLYETNKDGRGQKKKFDLRRYSGKRAKDWGYRGLPDEYLEPIADLHPVSRRPALTTSFEAAADAISNGYPVPVCSTRGFHDVRDRDGFLKPKGKWHHCMTFVAVRGGRRPGLLVDNSSWVDWCRGPNPDNVPTGCGWVDARDADSMLRQDDSFAIPGVNGFVIQEIDHSPW
jgi:hypothetical protein